MYKLLKEHKIRMIIVSLLLILVFILSRAEANRIEQQSIAEQESVEIVEIEEPILEENKVEPKREVQIQSVPQFERDLGEPKENLSLQKQVPTITHAGGEPIDIDFLAKLIWAEGGTMSWEGQVLLCSAILNLCDLKGISVWTAGHTYNIFSVAYYVDSVTPSNMQYEVIDYVFNGGRNDSVCYFRTGRYHSFGTPYCCIDGVYFSSE